LFGGSERDGAEIEWDERSSTKTIKSNRYIVKSTPPPPNISLTTKLS
jgi:hypothetical protein